MFAEIGSATLSATIGGRKSAAALHIARRDQSLSGL